MIKSKVKVTGSNFYLYYPCEHSRINILQWILIKLGTYLVLVKIWNSFDFQGHRVQLLDEGLRHVLHCLCVQLLWIKYCWKYGNLLIQECLTEMWMIINAGSCPLKKNFVIQPQNVLRSFYVMHLLSSVCNWLILKLGVLKPLSTIFQLYYGDQFQRKPERTTDHGQATCKLYHLQLRVKCSLFSSPGHRPSELLSWVSVRRCPSVSFSHLNLLCNH